MDSHLRRHDAHVCLCSPDAEAGEDPMLEEDSFHNVPLWRSQRGLPADDAGLPPRTASFGERVHLLHLFR